MESCHRISQKANLQGYLDKLGFQLVGYGCTTCIGNSGPLDEKIENAIKNHDLIAVSVLSGNRNFEARIHSSVKANFLKSPPLVIAFAIAGKIDIDMEKEPIGEGKDGKPVFLKDIWPSAAEIGKNDLRVPNTSNVQRALCKFLEDNPLWKEIDGTKGTKFAWDKASTYIQLPPYFEHFTMELPPFKELKNMRCLALFGDSVTTDHISPAGAFSSNSPAGQFLLSKA